MLASLFSKSACLGMTLIVLLLVLATVAHGERLPIKIYTTADGLPNNEVNKIVRDSRGFLWFCTQEGLSRFDGYTFTNYGTAEGLPHPNVNDILETRGGEYWVATNAGLVRFNPKGRPAKSGVSVNDAGTPAMFTVVVTTDEDRHARYISALLEAQDGQIWCGTYKGLYRLQTINDQLSLGAVDVGMPNDYPEQHYINDLVEDRYGSLWLATPAGLYRRWRDGSSARYTKREGLPDDFLHDLLLDHQGQLWVGTRNAGFFRLTPDETHARPSVAFALNTADTSQSGWINQLFETSDHRLWAGIAHGLLEFFPEGDTGGRRYHIYTLKNGLSDDAINALAEDTAGNLWLGSGQGGVMKLAHNGIVTYDRQDGIMNVQAIYADRAGGVCFRGYVLGDKHASIFDGGKVDLLNQSQAIYWPRLGHFDGHHLTWFLPDALKGKSLGWVGEGVTLQARNGEWWITMGSQEGLYRFPPADDFTQIKGERPLSIFGRDSVLAGRQVFRIFEDSHERVWISTIDSAGNGLAVWDRETQTLRDLTNAPGLPSLHDDLARSFGEDSAGNVWIGFNTGVARFRERAFKFFSPGESTPPVGVMDIYTDRHGVVWLASSRSGLLRVDNSGAERPTFTSYTTAQGLSSNVILTVTEDPYGRIYLGTGQGLDQLDPSTGRVRHYTVADGLAGGKIAAAFCARDGWLWIGTSQGLSRFLPEPERQSLPPPVLLTGLRIAGSAQSVSALGETELKLPDLAASASQLQIDFVGLGFALGESLRYQYMLEGADRDWSAPTTQRTVTYPRLASGRYRFLVRAINADGQVSAAPAAVTFRVLPHVWQRWWFLALVAIALALVIYALYRYRVARILEVASMRMRIATDLHDDIGANLTKIALLSEIARQQQPNGGSEEDHPLSSIARISRESVAAMGDIVWAINPERDHLIDLTRRMRREAEELFAANDIKLSFQAPIAQQDLRLGVDVRRDLFLIFKEASNNSARHSRCTQVAIDLSIDGPWLSLRIADDGVGFDPSIDSDGQGLESMRRRAENLGGKLTIQSNAKDGTTVTLKVPHSPSLRLFGEKWTGQPM
jgi:ligand-binding sensor domain-containing protein/signal transduction histidine kinase